MDIIQSSEIKKCPLCGEPTLEKHSVTGEYVHSQCAKAYDEYWDEREKEMRYRAATGNDPRIRSHEVWQI